MLLAWTCLRLTPQFLKNSVFDRVFPTREALIDLMSSASLSFAPGLLDVLQAASPPAISFFKSLPMECSKIWAIYSIVLEKPQCTPQLYIGSGTHAIRGVHTRFQQYDAGHNLPKHMTIAIAEGYKITYKGILCSVPLPGAADVPRLRIIFILLEATFTFVFWAIKINTRYGLGMHGLRRWSLSDFEYKGLCSHTPLMETVAGDLDLSPEELEAIAAARVAAQAARAAKSLNKIKLQSPERKREDFRRNTETFREANREKTRASCRATDKKNRDAKRFYDPECDRSFNNRHALAAHLLTSVHRARLAELQASSSGGSS